MEEKESKPLYMPYGLKLKKEYFRGFGKEELIVTIIAAVFFIGVDVVIYLLGNHNTGLLFFLPVIGTSIVGMLHIKGEMNTSPIDMIKQQLRFVEEQKFYPYIKMDEWDIKGADEK